MLTAKQIIEKGIVYLKPRDGIELEPAQIGIDLHMISCDKLEGIGTVYKDKKTELAKTEPVKAIAQDGESFWILEPGVYEIGFAEGCKFDDMHCGYIKHRSSIFRNGAEINSPWFDPGFETESIGSFLYVKHPIKIEVGARVGQMAVFTTEEKAALYNGQWQKCTVQSEGTDHEVKGAQ